MLILHLASKERELLIRQRLCLQILYVTGDGEYPSVSLGNVEDSFSFNVTLHNISDQDRTLKMIVNTDTDMVKNGFFTLTPRQLMQTVWPEVTVKAHSDQTVTVKIDVSQFSKELLKEMPNGYFIEGFVRFVNPTDDGDIVSLPFTGFRGQFQDLPAFEKPIYQLIVEGKDGFITRFQRIRALMCLVMLQNFSLNTVIISIHKLIPRKSMLLFWELLRMRKGNKF